MSNYRKFENQISASDIHGTISPADVRDGEAIRATLKSLDPKVSLQKDLRVWRISPLGIEVLLEDGAEIPRGLHISLDVSFGYQNAYLSGLVVDNVLEERGNLIAHIRLVPRQEERMDSVERRESSRWMCSDQFFPTAVASNPAKFNDFIYFKVKDISYGGFKLYTSLRNKFIIPGIVFDCIINFPMAAQANAKLTVKNVRVELENGREVLSLGVTFDSKNEHVTQVVGQYLMQFGSVQSLTDIQRAGFLVHSVSDAVSYSYVKSKEEFDEVLKLRFEAYKHAGKVEAGKTYLDMTDKFDAKSRIIIGKYKGEVVSSARMIFHQVGESMEQERFVKWPANLPRPDEVVEIMRACTRPDFRGSDLLIGMFKYMAITVAQAKKGWIVICATDEMAGFYEKIGFKKADLSYEHTGLNNIVHHVMIANFIDGMSGRAVGPIYWNLVWADSVKYMSQYEMIDVDAFMQIRQTIYRWLNPIAKMLYTKKLKKRVAHIKHKMDVKEESNLSKAA